MKNRKLQVFVSSTYKDLKEERQAAVQAILTAGHIPAGMELFTAGDESQMDVIKRWIDESDVYLLILGTRYGGIEPNSQKSYTHLEYDYAIKQGKPTFVVVISDEHWNERIKESKNPVSEFNNNDQLQKFRSIAKADRMVRFWGDPRDIKLAIMETMPEFSNREKLIGWVPGDQAVNSASLAEEMRRLSEENARLRRELDAYRSNTDEYMGLNFEQVKKMLKTKSVSVPNCVRQLTRRNVSDVELITKYLVENDELESVNQALSNTHSLLKATADTYKDSEPNVLHLLWLARNDALIFDSILFEEITRELTGIGLIDSSSTTEASYTDAGKRFINRLRAGSTEAIKRHKFTESLAGLEYLDTACRYGVSGSSIFIITEPI